jgi:hypothetical protein
MGFTFIHWNIKREIYEKISKGGRGERRGVGRAKSIILTKLEEAFMWMGKAVRDDQIERDKKTSA